MMFWCELCRDHFEVDHFDEEGDFHFVGPQYGPVGADLVRRQFTDLVLGKDAVLWQNTPDDPRTFEIRVEGKHQGFVSVLESGEVVWV